MALDRKQHFSQTKAFAELQAKWDKRLEEAGFEDAERSIGGDKVLKQFHQGAFKRTYHESPHSFEDKAQYYRLAGQFLHSHKFDTKQESLIWQLHSEGVSKRLIVQKLKSSRMKVTESIVKEVIYRLAAIMKAQIGTEVDDE